MKSRSARGFEVSLADPVSRYSEDCKRRHHPFSPGGRRTVLAILLSPGIGLAIVGRLRDDNIQDGDALAPRP